MGTVAVLFIGQQTNDGVRLCPGRSTAKKTSEQNESRKKGLDFPSRQLKSR